jgi:hypothetical protein
VSTRSRRRCASSIATGGSRWDWPAFGQLSEPEPPFPDLDALILSPEFARLLLVDASIGRRGCASCPCAAELNAALRDMLEEIDVDVVNGRVVVGFRWRPHGGRVGIGAAAGIGACAIALALTAGLPPTHRTARSLTTHEHQVTVPARPCAGTTITVTPCSRHPTARPSAQLPTPSRRWRRPAHPCPAAAPRDAIAPHRYTRPTVRELRGKLDAIRDPHLLRNEQDAGIAPRAITSRSVPVVAARDRASDP